MGEGCSKCGECLAAVARRKFKFSDPGLHETRFRRLRRCGACGGKRPFQIAPGLELVAGCHGNARPEVGDWGGPFGVPPDGADQPAEPAGSRALVVAQESVGGVHTADSQFQLCPKNARPRSVPANLGWPGGQGAHPVPGLILLEYPGQLGLFLRIQLDIARTQNPGILECPLDADDSIDKGGHARWGIGREVEFLAAH